MEAADRVVEGRRPVAANLRFAHAETLMPLLSLLQINGCYYLTHYFDQVATNWQDFNIVPMAANLQFIFFKNEKGDVYVRTDLNELPVTLIPDNPNIYLPWQTVRDYLLNFILITNWKKSAKNRPKILQFAKMSLPLQRKNEMRAFSSAGSEHLPYKQRVGGSNPSTPTEEEGTQSSFLFFLVPPQSFPAAITG